MINLPFLEVAIGLFFVYLVLSLLASAIAELLESVLRMRGRYLAQSIANMLGACEVGSFYKHPAISALFFGTYAEAIGWNPRWRLPSYVPPRNFALAFIDRVLDDERGHGRGCENEQPGNGATVDISTLERLRRAVSVAGGTDTEVAKTLRSVMRVAGDDIGALLGRVEDLFEKSQDRVTGRYKRHVSRVLFLSGFLLAIVLNADTIQLVRYLSERAPVRGALMGGGGVGT